MLCKNIVILKQLLNYIYIHICIYVTDLITQNNM